MKTIHTLRSMFPGLIVAAVGVLYLAAPTAARADFAAIAYSESTGNYGYRHLGNAEREALAKCGAGDARVVIWSENAWCALAVGDNGAIGYGWANSEGEARRIALHECRKHGGDHAHIDCTAFSGT